MTRDAEQLQSLVIVRCRNGYEATARFTNPLHDFIVMHEYKWGIYSAIARLMRDGGRRHGRR